MTYLVQVQNVLFFEVLVELLVFFPYVVELPVFVVAPDDQVVPDVLLELVFVAAQSFDLLVEVELVFQVYQHVVELFHLL